MAIVKANFYTQDLNQLQPKRLRGEYLDWGLNAEVMEGQVDSSVTDTLYPGDRVKIVSSSTGKIKIAPTAAGEAGYGYILYNTKKLEFKAGDIVSILRDGGVISAVTEAAIDAGTVVYFQESDGSVVGTANTNNPMGIALAKVAATTGGTLIPVEVVKEPLA